MEQHTDRKTEEKGGLEMDWGGHRGKGVGLRVLTFLLSDWLRQRQAG